MAAQAATPATTGETTAGSSTLSSTCSKCTPLDPAPTQTAPISPPNRACEELEGSPASQVARFHRIAPTSPAKIIAGVTRASSTMPPEIVRATSVDRNAPAILRTPLIRTAILGRSAPVAMEVAIAFAVSWNPFVKSNASAVTMTTATSNVMWSMTPANQDPADSARTGSESPGMPRRRRGGQGGP